VGVSKKVLTDLYFLVIIISMKQKFIAIPSAIYSDLISGKMIASDLMIYMYLCSKAAHGKPIFTPRSRMISDLGDISLSRLNSSLKRLTKSGHIRRKKLNGVTSTKLLTFVKDKNNILIKGNTQ
jgi:hypothetical protein